MYAEEGSRRTDNTQPMVTAMFTEQTAGSYGEKHPKNVKFAESVMDNLIVSCDLPISIDYSS